MDTATPARDGPNRGGILPALILWGTVAAGCGSGDGPAPAAAPAAAPQEARTLFPEITDQALPGVARDPWPDGQFDLAEIMGGGVALLDYDNDGDLDVIEVRCPPPGQMDSPAPNRLFRQEADGTFSDVGDEAGIADPGFGQGVAVADVDNDGDLDVYFTNIGADGFYRNNGDGSFSEETAAAGFSGNHWSVSAAFVDFDADGDLDLYVVHYVEWLPDVRCRGGNLSPEYCGPQEYPAATDTLYRNDGDGTFTDVTAEAGVTAPGNGLGVLCADLTGDDVVDIYVTNDREVNRLWINKGDGTFLDEAVVRGVGFNADGRPEASMGVTIGDTDNDGRFDLFMTHLRNESNTLYAATDYGGFDDVSDASRLAMIDRPFTGFGCGFADLDHDGDLDLAVANGKVARGAVVDGADLGDFWNLYGERDILFENAGDGRFSSMELPAGGYGSPIEVSRGLAFGDIDGDGDLDLVVGSLGRPPRIYRNEAPTADTHWLLLRAVTGRRDAIGAQVTLRTGETQLSRLVLAAYSYASSSDPRVHFGLGAADHVDVAEVLWPDGTREQFDVEGVDREITLRKGQGRAQ